MVQLIVKSHQHLSQWCQDLGNPTAWRRRSSLQRYLSRNEWQAPIQKSWVPGWEQPPDNSNR